VEVLAYGAVAALTELERWLHQGPPLASVARVESLVVEPVEVDSFRIG